MLRASSLVLLLSQVACDLGAPKAAKPKKPPLPLSQHALDMPALPDFAELESFWQASFADAERPVLSFKGEDKRFRIPKASVWLTQGRSGQLLRLRLIWARGQSQRVPTAEIKSELLRLQASLLNSPLSPPFEVMPRATFESETIPAAPSLTLRFFFEINPLPKLAASSGLKESACRQVRQWVHAVQLMEGARPDSLPILAMDCDVVLDPAPVEEMGLTLNRFPLPIVYSKTNRFIFRRASDLSSPRLLRQFGRKL
jgi:hypothetical protein